MIMITSKSMKCPKGRVKNEREKAKLSTQQEILIHFFFFFFSFSIRIWCVSILSHYRDIIVSLSLYYYHPHLYPRHDDPECLLNNCISTIGFGLTRKKQCLYRWWGKQSYTYIIFTLVEVFPVSLSCQTITTIVKA